ncbi:MAG: hypothetical protein ACLUIS_02190 [Longibaculum sp.]
MFNQSCGNQQGCSCQMNSMMSDCGMDNAQMAGGFNGCPRPQPLVAPKTCLCFKPSYTCSSTSYLSN